MLPFITALRSFRSDAMRRMAAAAAAEGGKGPQNINIGGTRHSGTTASEVMQQERLDKPARATVMRPAEYNLALPNESTYTHT